METIIFNVILLCAWLLILLHRHLKKQDAQYFIAVEKYLEFERLNNVNQPQKVKIHFVMRDEDLWIDQHTVIPYAVLKDAVLRFKKTSLAIVTLFFLSSCITTMEKDPVPNYKSVNQQDTVKFQRP